MKDLQSAPTLIRWPSTTSKSATDRFHTAVVMGKSKKLRKLVSTGTLVDIRNQDGQTGLFVAAILGKEHVVRTLLELGANPNARCNPEGYTALHGACYIGSIQIIRSLLAAGGDLRLTDTKRQPPEDWIQFQEDIVKRKLTREFIEKLRFCIMTEDLNTMKGELHDKVKNLGVSFGSRMWNLITKCGGQSSIINEELLDNQIFLAGFGKIYFATGSKCAEVIGIPSINETTDLKLDGNSRAPSWINGKFSTFIPMTWDKRNTDVTSKVLRRKSVEEAVPDILVAELSVLVRIQHPHVLMILAVCQEENYDSLSLVFEKVSLGSLYYFLHQQNLRMKSTFATDIVIQISEALDYVHGCGFLHCGISSHAVMLVSETQAKLACFEYAIPEDERAAQSFLSSRHPWLDSDSHLSVLRNWMAPEVLTGTHRHSQASDVYSLCCVMWELVVGDVPWKDYDLPGLRTLFAESPGMQLAIRKDLIPPLWLSVLQVGLKRKREERDLDFKEVRYMMSLAKERSSNSCGGAGDRRSTSRVSLRSVNPVLPSMDGDNVAMTIEMPEGIDSVDMDKGQTDSPGTSFSRQKSMSKTTFAESYKSEAYLVI